MDPIKTVLLLAVVFLVIVILIRQSYPSDKKECYYSSFDDKFNDPYVNPYSNDITFRPTFKNEPAIRLAHSKNDGTSYSTDASLSRHLSMDDPMNNDPTKLFTHIEDQDMGPYEYSNTYDTDPIHMQQITANVDEGMAYIPDKLSELRGVREEMTESDIDNLAIINMPIDYKPDLMLNRLANRQNNSNSVEKITNNFDTNTYTANNLNDVGDYQMKPVENFCNSQSQNEIGSNKCNNTPYSDSIKNFPHMNMSDRAYTQSLRSKNSFKTYIKDENKCPTFDNSCISSLPYENMHDVVNKYNAAALDSIDGSYRNIRKDLMYDKMN